MNSCIIQARNTISNIELSLLKSISNLIPWADSGEVIPMEAIMVVRVMEAMDLL